MDCIVHGVVKSWTQLSDFPFHFASGRSAASEPSPTESSGGPDIRDPL